MADNTWKWELATGILGLVVLVLLYFLIRGSSYSPVQPINNPSGAPVGVYTSDSLKVRQQEFLIVQSQATINSLQDSIERLTSKITNTIPQYIIRYRDTLRVSDLSLAYRVNKRDSVVIDSLMHRTDSLTASIYNSPNVLIVPRAFADSGQFFKVNGIVTKKSVDITNLDVYNKTSVIIGQKGSWLQNKTVVVNIAEDNPLLTSGQVQSYQYVPKERKWRLVAGPAVLFNGKSFSKGIALVAGYSLY